MPPKRRGWRRRCEGAVTAGAVTVLHVALGEGVSACRGLVIGFGGRF